MQFRYCLFLLASLLAFSSNAYAAEIIGQGTTQCEKFLKLTELNEQVEDTFMNWAEGYVSGLTYERAQYSSEIDASIFLFHYSYDKEKIRQYCQQYPQSSYKDAVHHTLKQLLQDVGTDIGTDNVYKVP